MTPFYSAAVITAATETTQKVTAEVTQQINTQKQQIEQIEIKLEGCFKILQDNSTTFTLAAPKQIIDTSTNTFIGLISQNQCLTEKTRHTNSNHRCTTTHHSFFPYPIFSREMTQQITVLTKTISATISCLDQKLTPPGPSLKRSSKERLESELPACNPHTALRLNVKLLKWSASMLTSLLALRTNLPSLLYLDEQQSPADSQVQEIKTQLPLRILRSIRKAAASIVWGPKSS